MTAHAFSVLPQEIVAAAGRGWHVLPVQARGKLPLVKGWREAATSDITQLVAWADQYPACNWGLATGTASGLVVIDVDGAEGRASLADLEQQGFTLQPTLTVSTGRTDGGEHRYYRLPSGIEVHNDQSGKIGPHIDVRGQGGQAVIPPSIHASGKQYSFVDVSAPVADLPYWVIERLTRRPPMLTATAQESRQAVVKASRTNRLVSLAGTLQKREVDPATIEAALLAENAAFDAPLSEAKVRNIAADIVKRYPAAETNAGGFFAVDSRIWKNVTDFGMNEAIAYLVLACGTGHGNKVTSWSTKSVMKYAGVGWERAKHAIEQLIMGGSVCRAENHTPSKPRYELASYRELMDEGLHPANDADSADCASQRGSICRHAQGLYQQPGPSTEDSGDNLIWLPNAIVTENSSGDESPIQRLRSAGRMSALKLFVDLYTAQNLRDDGGINPRYIRQRFDRREIEQLGPYTIWGFKPATCEQWRTGPLDAPGNRLPHFNSLLQLRLLELNTDSVLQFVDLTKGIKTQNRDGASVGSAQTFNALHRGGLSRSIGAD